MTAVIVVDVCYTMLALDGVLGAGDVIIWVTFVDVDTT